jgi:hypothetical protein
VQVFQFDAPQSCKLSNAKIAFRRRLDDVTVVARKTGAFSDGTQFASARVMARASLVRRVEILEDKVETLSDLPQRVTAVEENLAALRTEMRQGFARVDGRLDGMDTRFTHIDGELATLRKEMREGDEETRRQMRVLHEDVIGRLALIQEQGSRTKSSPEPKRRRPKP